MKIPEFLVPNKQPDQVSISLYSSDKPSERSKVTLTQNLFSILLEGEKIIHHAGETLTIHPDKFLLLTSGNCLMSEKLSTGKRYESILLFFDDKVLTDFFRKHPVKQTAPQKAKPITPFLKDAFLNNYIHSLQIILASGSTLSQPMIVLKAEELLLYLLQQHPETISSLAHYQLSDISDDHLRAVMEANLEENITIEELAFLCNNSLSTFKRRFSKLYGTSPSKWILQKRMERAASLLLQVNEKPSLIYHKVGYENHSSFSQSFKQFYGISPSEYQSQKVKA